MATLNQTRFYPTDRIALFIDGNSIFSAIKGTNKKINYSKINNVFAKHGKLIASYYYTPVKEEDEFIALQPLIDFLSYNGYRVRTKPFLAEDRRPSMNIDMACDMFEQINNIDHYVLFSGDGEFTKVVELLQKHGKRVTVITSKDANNNQLSDSLHRTCDFFASLDTLDIFEETTPNSKLYD